MRAKCPAQDPPQRPNPANRCKRRNGSCRYCPIIGKGTRVRNNTTGERFTTMRNVCCQSSNLIYLIECQVCHIHYVGQTKRPFLRRMYEHLRDIDRGMDHTVARHFEVHGPPNAPPISFYALQYIKHTRTQTQPLNSEMRLKRTG